MDTTRATANAQGDVPLSVSFSGPANGTLTLEVIPSGTAADIAALTKPVILGTKAFRVHHGGKIRLTVPLSSVGRRRLARSHKIHAVAVITFSKHGKSARTSAPLTLKKS
jgi:hypothetical protein